MVTGDAAAYIPLSQHQESPCLSIHYSDQVACTWSATPLKWLADGQERQEIELEEPIQMTPTYPPLKIMWHHMPLMWHHMLLMWHSCDITCHSWHSCDITCRLWHHMLLMWHHMPLMWSGYSTQRCFCKPPARPVLCPSSWSGCLPCCSQQPLQPAAQWWLVGGERRDRQR